MMMTPVAQQVLVPDALQKLAALHQELTSALAALAEETRRPAADLKTLPSLRLKLSKASRQRGALLDAILDQRIHSSPPGDLPVLLELRRTVQQARAASTAHVSHWTPQAVAENWDDYCQASLTLRRAMAAQIDREARLLYPRPPARQQQLFQL